MPGTRRRSRRHWPDYLLARTRAKGLYYYWKDPRDNKEYGLGYDFSEAASQAREANAKLVSEKKPIARLLDRLTGQDKNTMGAWLDRFADILSRRNGKGGSKRSENTIKADLFRVPILRKHFGDILVANVTTRHCMDLLNTYTDQGKARSAQSLRSFLIDCFSEAEAAGWITRGSNPASITKPVTVKVNRARLSLEQFKAILEYAIIHEDLWVSTSFLLAITTAQRLSDVGKMRFDDSYDGFLHIIQDKEGHPIRLPLELGLPQFGMTISEIIKKARLQGIVGSQNIVHHTFKRTLSMPGDRVHDNTISKGFTKILRKVFPNPEKEWAEKTPPTFHEIRSLSKRLYDDLGVNTLLLLGHKSEDSAALYRDLRGDWWTVPLPKKTGS